MPSSVLPATGAEISLGRVNKAYTNLAYGTANNSLASLGTQIGISSGLQVNLSASFGGRTAPFNYYSDTVDPIVVFPGKIICTKLYELGLIGKNIYEADQAFGVRLVKERPDMYNGYIACAKIVVEWMDGRGPKMIPWMTDEEFSVAVRKWSITWAQDIATPWAEELAYHMGKLEKSNLPGRMIMAVGLPICKAVGVWRRWFGASKKPPGFFKGLMLIPVFIMFKLVAELGRLIERKQNVQYTNNH